MRACVFYKLRSFMQNKLINHKDPVTKKASGNADILCTVNPCGLKYCGYPLFAAAIKQLIKSTQHQLRLAQHTNGVCPIIISIILYLARIICLLVTAFPSTYKEYI